MHQHGGGSRKSGLVIYTVLFSGLPMPLRRFCCSLENHLAP
ncbi:hypothetical protein T1E_0656 [Pseudomonas putida DOT-T1E]|uniref:Uncharacterized protein n=1 Tax=Pseudomonas putida (strain DOT-T1E) TaxID=1196325 RepID=I7C4F0_PSEPT|nr:hypothetical protein T1E_0656 [Pseudomonas putida DOT-T1E]